MSHDHDTHAEGATPASTVSAQPALGGSPKWIGYLLFGAVLLLVVLFFVVNKDTLFKNNSKTENSNTETKGTKTATVQTGVMKSLKVSKGNWERIDVPEGYRVLTYTGNRNLPFLYKDECAEKSPIEVGGGQTHNIGDCSIIYLSTNELADTINYKFVSYQSSF